MAELEEMIAEILHELDDMSPEDIEEIRTEWLVELKKVILKVMKRLLIL